MSSKVSSFSTVLVIGSAISACCRAAVMVKDELVKDVLYFERHRESARRWNMNFTEMQGFANSKPFFGCYQLFVGRVSYISVCLPVRVFTSVPTCSHLHVSSQGADPPLTSSAGQEDGDDGQQGANGQQSTASWAEHRAGLRNTNTEQVHVRPTLIDTHTVAHIHNILLWKAACSVMWLQTNVCMFTFLSESYDSLLPCFLENTPPKPKSLRCGRVRLCNLTVNPPNRLMALSAGKQHSIAKQQGTVPIHYIFP